jgi:DNA invertase Pin-like site-specific DNA recombinase
VIDDGVSGAVPARHRKLWNIVKNSQKGDWVITSELSRIGRSTTDVLTTLDILAKKGVNVYFIKQGLQLDQSPMGKMMIAIMSAFAEMERDLIRQRTIEGLERARRQGKTLGRPVGLRPKFKRTKEEINELRGKGLPKTKVAELLEITPSTLYKYIRELEIKWE